MTLANRITLFRLLMIPVFALLIFSFREDRGWLRWLALGVYAGAAFSDIADGFVARRYAQRSRLGARLDPLADKLIVNLGFVFLAANPAFQPAVPMWFPPLVLARDVWIVMGAYLINEYFGPVKVKPLWTGKATTVFQTATLIGYLIGVFFAPYLLWLSVAATVISFADYTAFGLRQVAAKRADRKAA